MASKKDIIKEAIRSLAMKEPNPKDREESPITRSNELIPTEFPMQSAATTRAAVTNISGDEFIKAVNQAKLLDDNVIFQAFNPYHNDLAKPLFYFFYQINLTQLQPAINLVQKHVNKYLFQYILSLALRHRPDLKGEIGPIPAHITLAPHLYFEMGDIGIGDRINKKINLTGKFNYDHDSMDLEQRLEYFRLDPGLNAHHRHWHEAYLDAPGYNVGDETKLSRVGELFYYMHSQMVARYNFERISVGIPFVEPLTDLHKPLVEPYFSKLTTETRAKLWDSRPPFQKLSDVNTRGVLLRIQEVELSRSRIYEAIDRGTIFRKTKDGKEILETLNEPREKKDEKTAVIGPFDYGIDKLGNMVWAFERLSANFRYYGNLHNYGHVLIGFSHDPEGRFYKQSEGGAMSLPETSSRDPAFYRWHVFIDDVFQRYKATLPPYKIEEELEFKNIKIEDVIIRTVGKSTANLLKTKWAKDRVNITDGISERIRDLLEVEEVNYDFVHLTHENFDYYIKVNNTDVKAKYGTVRIFIAPIYTEEKYKEELSTMSEEERKNAEKRNPLLEPSFNKYRRSFVELDKFVVRLQPGVQTVKRSSTQSSVTIPLKQLFMTIDEALEYTQTDSEVRGSLSWCGCGWPDYLLIGRGNNEGLPCRVFVMISDYEKDKVGDWPPECSDLNKCCAGSLSYCGVRDSEYPDRKPMGYPFDRNVESNDYLLSDFMTKTRDPVGVVVDEPQYIKNIENMYSVEVRIQHVSETIDGPTIRP